MKLNNSALQELYDTLVRNTITISPYKESPIDKAFRECDEKLSGLLVFEHIENLEKDLDDAKNQLKYFTDSRDAWRGRAKHAENELEELKATLEEANTDRTELQNDRNFYHDLYAELRKDYDKLFNNYKKKCEDIWELKARLNSIYGKDPYYESCFNAMIDGFETMTCPYLGRPSITIQYDPDAIVFRKED